MTDLTEWQPDYPAAHTMADKLRALREGMRSSRSDAVYWLSDKVPFNEMADTLDRVAYGQRLTQGAGQTLKLRPEVGETAEFLLPMVPSAKTVVRSALETALQPMGRQALQRGAITFGDAPKYTLKSVENFSEKNQNIPVQAIKDQLKRQDISKSEKQIVEGALAGTDPAGTISATKLSQRLDAATKDFRLRAADTDEYADYGMANIGRQDPGFRGAYTEGEPWTHGPLLKPRTTVWELPNEVGAGNHFENPRYFGHTRAFEENGIPHVVEIQSDLAQHAGKTMSAAERAELEAGHANVLRQLRQIGNYQLQRAPGAPAGYAYVNSPHYSKWNDHFTDLVDELEKQNPDIRMKLGQHLMLENDLSPTLYAFRRQGYDVGDPHEVFEAMFNNAKNGHVQYRSLLGRALSSYEDNLNVLAGEHATKLSQSVDTQNLQPILKNWDRRLVREELSRAAGQGRDLQGLADTYRGIGDAESAAEKEAKIPKVVRFADADTVARVEGWSTNSGRLSQKLQDAQRRLQEANDQLAKMEYMNKQNNLELRRPNTDLARQNIADKQAEIDTIKRELESAPKGADDLIYDEHRGIYRRYKGDTEPYLKSLGGKHIVDEHGHGWWEVPVNQKRDIPTRLLGAGALGTGTYGITRPEDDTR